MRDIGFSLTTPTVVGMDGYRLFGLFDIMVQR